MATRLVRLASTLVIARRLDAGIVGEAALALSLFELIRVLAQVGIGQAIIAAPADALAATCNTARRLFTLWAALLTALQLAVAGGLALAGGPDWQKSAEMLAVLALVYPFTPAGQVQIALAQREGLAGPVSRCAATQTITSNLLSTALLLAWRSPWALVLPRLLTAPLWLAMARRLRPWQALPAAGQAPAAGLLRFGLAVLVAEIWAGLRTQGDNLLIAALLGARALGTYYFAFNAGVGIVSSLVSAFGMVVFPALCAAPRGAPRAAALERVLIAGLGLFLPLVALQSLAARWYVPIVFGGHWAYAAPLVGILCLSGAPQLVAAITSLWLRAEGRLRQDMAGSALSCVAALGLLALAAALAPPATGLAWAAMGLVAGQGLAALAYHLPILR
ncbi:MAG TPA: oligosaccharide flippase family protein, partial [Novosphingobium sp.]|nr:oligosaccharide flippase family protein [Novosphingobium sp.]